MEKPKGQIGQSKRFSILAVDDEPVNIELMMAALKNDYDILAALSGQDAVELLEERIPDLILLDVMMPVVSGYDVCRIIKADKRFADIPIIFLTSLDSHEGELQGLELGGIDYLTKPTNFDLLKLRIRNQIVQKARNDLMKEQVVQLASQKEELARMLAEQELHNKQLQESKAELIDLNQKLFDLNKHVLTVQEKERLAISRDIHDDIGQNLTILKLNLEWLEINAPFSAGDIKRRLHEMRENIFQVTDSIQRIAANLRPPLLDNAGLIAAIEWQAEELKKHCGLECFVMLNDDLDLLDIETSTVVIRIVQECLTNIARHARASEVSISLCKRDGSLLLEISDNGCGITREQMESPIAYGLIGMQERTKICGGNLVISGAPESGTTLILSIPLETGETVL